MLTSWGASSGTSLRYMPMAMATPTRTTTSVAISSRIVGKGSGDCSRPVTGVSQSMMSPQKSSAMPVNITRVIVRITPIRPGTVFTGARRSGL